MKKTRIFVLCCIVLMVLCLACACNKQPADPNPTGQEPGTNEPATPAKDSLVFGLSSEPISLDPIHTTDQMSWDTWISLYDTLFWYNATTGELENRLAESYSWNEDSTELTIKVREGVLFHNGQEMTAEDVAYSVDRIANGTYTKMYAVNYNHVEVVDTYTIKIFYDYPYEAALRTLAVVSFVIVPKAEVEKDVQNFQLNPIGTGPYKFVSRTTGVEIVMEANEDYWRGEPSIKNLKYKIFTDVNTAVVALEAGEVDLLTHAPLTSKAQIDSNPNVIWDEDIFYGPLFISFQQEPGELFSDVNLRKAVQYAINREDVLIGAADGIGYELTSMMLPGMYGYEEGYAGVEYNPEKAKEYLRAAGYENGKGPTIVIPVVDTVVYMKGADVVASQLMDVGFDVRVERVERSAFFADVYGKNEFTLVIGGWGVLLPDSDYLFGLAHSSQIGVGYNFSRINDPVTDDLITRGRNEPDPAEREKIYAELKQYVNDQAIFVPLIVYGAGVAYNKDLKGVNADILYRFQIFDYSW